MNPTTNEPPPRVTLDMYVLAQGVKTGVWRVCDELFPRLARSPLLHARLFFRPGDAQRATEYLGSEHGAALAGVERAGTVPDGSTDLLLSPFGVAPAAWRRDPSVLQAHIVYDLIAIRHPEYFSEVAAAEVADIIDGIDEYTVVFAISEFTKQDLLRARPDLSPRQVTVIPLAAGDAFRPCDDAARLAAVRLKYKLPADAPYVLSLATLEVRKNLDQVVNAFVRFLAREPQSPMHLVLAGMSGWKLEQLHRALDAAAAWRHRIVLTGFVDDADLAALYSGATCFVYLSRDEGFGLPPLEAMACGTPVISADNSSLPEVVGDAGILLDADDVEGVADAIGRLAAQPEERQWLSRAGLARATRFDWDRCAETVARVLHDAAIQHATRPSNRRAQERSARSLLARFGTPAGGPIEANLLDYQNGSVGPVFGRLEAADEPRSTTWPQWVDFLPKQGDSPRIEGGKRTRGELKFGTAEAPLVSYITVVRNNTATLRRTIESVQQQTYAPVEHIVLDGASTDGTIELIRSFDEQLDYYVSEPDKSLYDAINKAIPLARGQLVCVLNSDDWLEPDAAAIAAQRMRGRTEPAMLLTSALVRAGEIRHEWYPWFVHPGCFFLCANDCHNGIYVNRAGYERSGPYDIGYRIVADFKWIMACMESGLRFVYTRERTVNYSLGGTSGDVRQHSLECMRVVRERFPFLSGDEVSGLYHAFFQLAGPMAAQQSGRPDSLTDFVREQFTRHAGQADYQRALAWAAMATLRHPADAAGDAAVVAAPAFVPSIKRSVKDLVKSVLYKSPRLYRLGIRSYQRFRK